MNDSELVKNCLKGRRDAQRNLYERFAPGMLGVCIRYASSRMEAEDFLQEAFISVFRKLNQYKREGELGAWIRKIVVNTSLNGIKARHHFAVEFSFVSIEEIPNHAIPEVNATDKELMEMIYQLPMGCKTVFNLYAIEGYSHDEIAGMLGIKAVTSRSQYMKARRILTQNLNLEIKKVQNDRSNG